MSPRQRQLLVLVATALVLLAVWWAQGDVAGEGTEGPASSSPSSQAATPATAAATDPVTGLGWVEETGLPDEARDVLTRIDAGGPFKYPEHDGKTFGNFEGLLPDHERGYYREYTVELRPGVRGPLRIVTGADGEFLWTEDHYESFERIRR